MAYSRKSASPNAVKLRALRETARARGLCNTCRKREPRPGDSNCGFCCEAKFWSARNRITAGAFCVDCQAFFEHRYDCSTRRARVARTDDSPAGSDSPARHESGEDMNEEYDATRGPA